jgi:hypothetical protein
MTRSYVTAEEEGETERGGLKVKGVFVFRLLCKRITRPRDRLSFFISPK